MLIDIRKTKTDWILLGCIAVLLSYGLVAVYSSTHNSDLPQIRSNFNRQLVWLLLALVVGTVVALIPLNSLFSFAYGLYISFIVFLLILDFFPVGSGTSRWFDLGVFHFQPSEMMKPVLVVALARYLSENQRPPGSTTTLLTAFLLVFTPYLLVLKQPDLGTSLCYIVILLPMLFWRGLSPFILFVIIVPVITFVASFNFWTFFCVILIISVVLILSKRGLLVFWSVFLLNIAVGIIAPLLWKRLHEYQQQRVLAFLGLVSDPRGVGYQIIQSKVAIGSGGLFGKGLMQGTQTQLRFLPAQHTDFIFSVVAEELGFLGAVVLLGLFFLLLWRSLGIAVGSKNRFAALLVIGIFSIFLFQIVVNIGMTMGIMPVTGIPLPFVSYGGSSLLTSVIMAALVVNSSLHRFTYKM